MVLRHWSTRWGSQGEAVGVHLPYTYPTARRPEVDRPSLHPPYGRPTLQLARLPTLQSTYPTPTLYLPSEADRAHVPRPTLHLPYSPPTL